MNLSLKNMGLVLLALLMLSPTVSHARAFEMLGAVNYSLPTFNPKPPTYQSSGGGIGYSFFGRMELGPGMLESGFMYVPLSVTTLETITTTKFSGSFWTIPVMYRYTFWEPYLSLALGMDYAIEGGTKISTPSGTLNNSVGTYQSHFGAVASLEAKQDIGENLSVVLDFRYRVGLKESMNYQSTSLGTHSNVKTAFTIISLGIMKHLED